MHELKTENSKRNFVLQHFASICIGNNNLDIMVLNNVNINYQLKNNVCNVVQ